MKKIITDTSRRKFLRTTGATVVGSSLAFNVLGKSNANLRFNSDTIKVGLIGCGGRGTGAANQAINSDPNVVLTAMADVFEESMETSYNALLDENPDKVMVAPDQKFMGFDSYKKVLESDVDVVILATPPCFRPAHLEAAIDAGKHVFFEKPVAVDAPGIRRVIATAKKAKEKNLGFMSGFCWRYDYPKRATYDRLLDGAIGDIHTIYTTYNTGALWFKKTKPSWGKFKKELRNWLYYNWMSGDHIMEQAVHSLDLMSWAMGDVLPVSAVGTGGRQSRTEERFGNVYDHFSLIFEYPNGEKGFHIARQQKDCSRAYHIEATGTKGRANMDVFSKHEIIGKKNWEWEKTHSKKDKNNMYQTEHDELFASIRNGNPINDGVRAANSTMLALMGRMVAYTGETLTWDQAINSEEILGPKIDEYNWDLDWKMADVAQPGITKFK